MALLAGLAVAPSAAQTPGTPGGPAGVGFPPADPAAPVGEPAEEMVQLDFNDVELSVVIDTIARLTGRNFIYDDRVRGRVTIVSPTKIPVDQAFAVFESVLGVKGFTTVDGPGGSTKIIPLRDAKETNIDTVAAPSPTPNRDAFVTRLIPLRYIDAEAITNSLKPLVSKDAAMVAYAPTNTVILTDAGSNIRRVLSILAAIDVETYKEELAVIKINHADAAALGQQLAEIYGAEVSAAGDQGLRAARLRQPQVPGQPQVQTGEVQRDRVRIITDSRTNSLIVLAARTRLEDIRRLVAKLDVPVTGGGRIHVFYLKNADAEELAETLNAMLSGQPKTSGAGGAGGGIQAAAQAAAQAQGLRAAVTELAEGVTVTADKATNSLVIQASQEGFATLRQVIEQLDIRRPQVLVEALIMEVDVTDQEDLGINVLWRSVSGKNDFTLGSLTDSPGRPTIFGTGGSTTSGSSQSGQITDSSISNLIGVAARNGLEYAALGPAGALVPIGGTLIQAVIRASANANGVNVLSSPHILTSDNEEAEIKIGDNIPIISSRVQSAAGITTPTDSGSLATSVNIERQDVGITLRVTPQISEGDSLRLEIFQEITAINTAIAVGDPNQVGVPLSNRKVENTVVVKDGETVVIGGLISDNYQDNVNKVPWLGDIPFIGWFFKTTSRDLTKNNLLVFLTPHIVREPEDLEKQTIRKREEFRARTTQGVDLSEERRSEEDQHRAEAIAAGVPYPTTTYRNPARNVIQEHTEQYPVERMREIEEMQNQRADRQRAAESASRTGPRYLVLASVFRDEAVAQAKLQEILDAGFDATIVTRREGPELVFEIRVGPYDDLTAANRAAAVLRESFGLAPSVFVLSETKP